MSDRPTVADWLAKVPGLRRKGNEHVGPCPACGTGDDRLRITASGHAFCRVCAPDAAGYPTLLRAAGLNGAAAQPDRPVSRLPLNGAGKLVGTWTARDYRRPRACPAPPLRPAERHVKTCPWTKGVQAAKIVAAVPLRAPRRRRPGDCHRGGESGRRSGRARWPTDDGRCALAAGPGNPPSVLGTYGAETLPSGAVLAELMKRTREYSRFYLWPDNDAAGRKHMAKLAAGLIAAGADRTDLKVIEWTAAPPTGDAADWAAGGCTPSPGGELKKAAAGPVAVPAAADEAMAPDAEAGPVADRNADGLLVGADRPGRDREVQHPGGSGGISARHRARLVPIQRPARRAPAGSYRQAVYHPPRPAAWRSAGRRGGGA